jgi:ankyrin repeat protein
MCTIETMRCDQRSRSRATSGLRAALAAGIGMALCCTCLAQLPPTATEYAQYTGLFAAAARNDTTKIVKLLRAGEYAGMRDDHGRTPLHVAAWRKAHDAMRLLVRATHDPNVLDNDGYDIVAIAAAVGDVPGLRLALAMGCSPRRAAGPDGSTALIVAARRGDDAAVRALLHAGAPIDYPDKTGDTALSAAIAKGKAGMRQVATVRTLVAVGAKLDIADATGQTPLAVARARGLREIAEILERAGAK